MKHYAIAIDGPSGAGKSTLARILAAELHYIYVDTGALYRAIGLHVLRRGIDPKSETHVTAALDGLQIHLGYVGGEQRVWLTGEDVSGLIRTPEVSMAASAVSAHPPVRSFLLSLQRKIAAENDVIMDGRDIGTVVLPHADLKIFLSASAEDRAQRRYEELLQKGQTVTYDDVLRDMQARDTADATRAAAPLRAADDAVRVDTTGNTLEQSIALLKSLVEAHRK